MLVFTVHFPISGHDYLNISDDLLSEHLVKSWGLVLKMISQLLS